MSQQPEPTHHLNITPSACRTKGHDQDDMQAHATCSIFFVDNLGNEFENPFTEDGISDESGSLCNADGFVVLTTIPGEPSSSGAMGVPPPVAPTKSHT